MRERQKETLAKIIACVFGSDDQSTILQSIEGIEGKMQENGKTPT